MCSRQWLVLAFLALVPMAAGPADDGFVPLVKGDDPAQFDLVGIGADAIKIADGEVRLTGKPNGYFATKDAYRNYVLRFDWKYDRPEALKSDARFDGNSGLLVHTQKPHKVWPKSIEVQLFNPDAGHIFAIFGSKFEGQKDANAQKRAIKPIGEWNQEEVTCDNGKIVCKLNGIVVDRGTGALPDSGYIGWQSEGAPIRFRNLKIKKLN